MDGLLGEGGFFDFEDVTSRLSKALMVIVYSQDRRCGEFGGLVRVYGNSDG
jgi:hypothetical protein